ncbi:XRE family transcriptional regulator [Acidipila sp. EB88]|nr:XRE family transcriptional regulator [Acidipila sp. EB88]
MLHEVAREVLRCERCQLVQFRTTSGFCRRCHKPLEVEEPAVAAMQPQLHATAPTQELDVARAVRALRHTRGLSQRQLAARMDVPRTYISKIENGKAMPTLSSLQRLATALEAEVGELLHDARSRRSQALANVLSDPFLCEVLPLCSRLNAFQQQVLLSHARDMARDGAREGVRLQTMRA